MKFNKENIAKCIEEVLDSDSIDFDEYEANYCEFWNEYCDCYYTYSIVRTTGFDVTVKDFEFEAEEYEGDVSIRIWGKAHATYNCIGYDIDGDEDSWGEVERGQADRQSDFSFYLDVSEDYIEVEFE